jgi:multidrug efflux pump subunit AcrA (membrane-fusion protein)
MPDPNNPYDPTNATVGIFPSAQNTGQRNPAQVALLAKLLGLGPEASDGSVSQQQLQDTYSNYQATDPALLAQRKLEMTKAQMPLQQTQLQGQNEMARTQAEVAGRSNVEQMREKAAAEEQQQFMQQEPQIIEGLPPNSTYTTKLGGTVHKGGGPPPLSAPEQQDYNSKLQSRLKLENPSDFDNLRNMFSNVPVLKATTEGDLDRMSGGSWRDSAPQGFNFVTPDPRKRSGGVPGGQPNIAKPAGIPSAGRITGKSKSTGAPVYSDDGGKTWFGQ